MFNSLDSLDIVIDLDNVVEIKDTTQDEFLDTLERSELLCAKEYKFKSKSDTRYVDCKTVFKKIDLVKVLGSDNRDGKMKSGKKLICFINKKLNRVKNAKCLEKEYDESKKID